MLLIQSDFTFLPPPLFFLFFFVCVCTLGSTSLSRRGPRAPCTCLAPAPRTSPGRVQEILGALHVLQSCCYCVGHKAQKRREGAAFFFFNTFTPVGGGGAAAESHEAKSP